MLLWFVDLQVAETTLARKKTVEECDMEVRPECVPSSCLDKNVCLTSIQKYFTPDAWCAVVNVVESILLPEYQNRRSPNTSKNGMVP